MRRSEKKIEENAEFLDTIFGRVEKGSTRELSRRLSAAFISTQGGIGLDYAYKRYLKDKEPGDLWYMISGLVMESMGYQGFEKKEGVQDETNRSDEKS